MNGLAGLPRRLSPGLLWTGRCQEFDYLGKSTHSHQNAFLVKGSERTMLIDTGAPSKWSAVERDVQSFLDGRTLDFVFPTHPEFPHGGLLPRWLEKYPDALIVGDLRDSDLYYPDLVSRFRTMYAGDQVDLGDRSILFLPALWRDLPTTLWAFDTGDRALFVSDALAFLHFHDEGECPRLTSEQPPVDVSMMRFNNERTLIWTRFADAAETFPDFDRLVRELNVRLIAPGHGNVIDNLDVMIPLAKQALAAIREVSA